MMQTTYRNSVIVFAIIFLFFNAFKVYSQSDCKSSVKYADKYICLPYIEGMTECYSVPIVKAVVDLFDIEGNTTLAFYLNDKIYKNVHRLLELEYDDYIKIYAPTSLMQYKIKQEELDIVKEAMKEELFSGLMIKLEDILKEKELDELKFDRPILIDEYSINSNVRTLFFLTKVSIEDHEYFSLATLNIIRVKEKLILLAYYKDYDNHESINFTKAKNDYIVLKLIQENN